MFKTLRKKIGWIFTVLFMFVLVVILAFQTAAFLSLVGGGAGGISPLRGDRIGVVTVTGGIFQIQEQLDVLKRYEENESIRGVLLEIDSPGGSVAPSQELSEAVARVSSSGKPVVVSIRNVGASGGYYVASSADTIVANPGSIVGSIGVIMQFMNVQELAKKVGIGYEIIKSGKFKDVGFPFREMTETEREYLRQLIMDTYDQFIEHIVEQRPELTRSELVPIADGRVFTGRQALDRELIDRLGTRHEAVQILTRAAGLKEPRLIHLGKQRFGVMESLSRVFSPLTRLLERERHGFRLLYMMPDWGKSLE